MKHINIKVKGKVQKVYFRATTKAVADQLGAKGFVVNLEDGSVYIEAEGDDFALQSLVEFCHEGTDRSEIESVEVQESLDIKGFRNFEVLKRLK
ncbi:acylphosphatase [Sphingobacterium bovistauri]|uniref:acylphosphatase n=1 Tax=Sphingobacterium bovistauri TaxID=2781959 RepID=A0ABS7Z2F3_9SPHI|nr:acylphosphatase [Sphingobacterium bovistauri]MCA5004333.1 acylphosphatase [Sphingobacterium bovistauri]